MNRAGTGSGNASTSATAGGGLVDILNQLDSSKRNEMLSLVGQYKGRSLGLNEFMLRARELLGDRLYNQLARDMSNAAAARGAGVPQMTQNTASMPGLMPGMSMPGIPHQMRPPMSASQMPMHSMPLIYGNQPQNLINPNQFPILQSGPMASLNSAPIEIDVTKMDTSSLQDVMQYSGVDLKAEAELLYRENDSMSIGSGSAASVDHRLKFDYFFNPFKFRAIVQHALQRHFFSNTLNSNIGTDQLSGGKMNKPLGITEEAVHLLGIAIQKRLIGILRRLSEISRHRVDYGRGRFKIKIENDPKKQLWLQEKLFIEGVGEEKRRTAVSATTVTTSSTASIGSPNPNATINPAIASYPTPLTASGNQTLLNPPSLATINAAAAAANKPVVSNAPSKSGASTASGAPGADDTVKTKLANSTALAALGVRQKSWMSAASTGPNSGKPSGPSTSTSSSTSSSNQPQSSDQSEEKEPTEVFQQHPLASFYSLPSSTPLTDAELRAQYFNRTISIVDLITCMETDPHLKRSRLLAVLYEALPRENKENKESASKDNTTSND